MKTHRSFTSIATLAFMLVALTLFGCSAPEGASQHSAFTYGISPNSGNPYDTLGQDHNQEFEWIIAHTDSTSPVGTDTIAYKTSIVDTEMKAYLSNKYGATSSEVDSFVTLGIDARDLVEPTYFDTISTASGLTSHEVSYFNRFGHAMGAAESNGFDYMDSILAIESSIVADSWAPGENHAQKMISVAKWSCYLWTTEASTLWKNRFGIIPPSDTAVPDKQSGDEGGAIMADVEAEDWGPLGVFFATLFYSKPAY